MPEFYATNVVVEDKFIFISYSHNDKALVDTAATHLINEGVRLWYDSALTAGDEWRFEVEKLLRHENCCGAILFCSPDALKSDNVAREREISLDEQTKRGKENYPLFIVNVSHDRPISYMQMLKKTFEQSDENCKDFTLDNLRVYMEIVGRDPICIMTHIENYEDTLFAGIRQKIPQVINKSAITLEQMEKAAQKNAIVSLKLGVFKQNGDEKALTWRFLYNDGDDAVFILEDVLEAGLGFTAEQWLNSEFKAAFTQGQAAKLKGSIRLLSKEEAQNTETAVLCKGVEWWLADKRGSLQMIVREDGTLYINGYNNKRFQKGIRPVIVLTMEDAKELMDSANN